MCELKCCRISCYGPQWVKNCCVCPIVTLRYSLNGVETEITLDHANPQQIPAGATILTTSQELWSQLKRVKRIFCQCPKIVDCWPPLKVWVMIPVLKKISSSSTAGTIDTRYVLEYMELNVNPCDITKQTGTIKLPSSVTDATGATTSYDGPDNVPGQQYPDHTRYAFFDIFTELHAAVSTALNDGKPLPRAINFINCDAPELSSDLMDIVACVPLPFKTPPYTSPYPFP